MSVVKREASDRVAVPVSVSEAKPQLISYEPVNGSLWFHGGWYQ